MPGLTREKVPGLVTAVYAGLVLYCLSNVWRGADMLTWELALMGLTFPLSLSFYFFAWALPGLAGPVFFSFLALVFAACNGLAIRRVSRNIVGED